MDSKFKRMVLGWDNGMHISLVDEHGCAALFDFRHLISQYGLPDWCECRES